MTGRIAHPSDALHVRAAKISGAGASSNEHGKVRVYPITFVDATWDPSIGPTFSQTPAQHARAAASSFFAASRTPDDWPLNSLVMVARLNNRWWILSDPWRHVTTRKYDSTGLLLWTADHGAEVTAIAVDPAGHVYTGGALTGGVSIRKYDPDGVLLWSVTNGTSGGCSCLCVDASGNVYTGSSPAGGMDFDTVRKYDTSGNLLWSNSTTFPVVGKVAQDVRSIAVDSSGNVYAVAIEDSGSNGTLTAYDDSGAQLWLDFELGVFPDPVQVLHPNLVAVNGHDELFVAGEQSDYSTSPDLDNVRQIDPADGSVIWAANLMSDGTPPGDGNEQYSQCIAADNSGKVYLGGAFAGNTLQKGDAGGPIWSDTHDYPDTVNGVALDQAGGKIYTANRNGLARQFDTSPALQWTRDHTGQLNAAACDAAAVYVAGKRVFVPTSQ